MANQPPDYCHYCGSELRPIEEPMIFSCGACEQYVYYNPTPGGSTAVVDGDRVLLVEDVRSPGEWKLPAGRIDCGESAREGVARELEEETGLSVDPGDLVYFYDSAGEPVEGQYMVNIDFAIRRAKTTGDVEAGSDAIDARFWTPDEFAASENSIKHTHFDRFGTDSLPWLLGQARDALEG